jgi:hypothetical protein
VTVISRFQLGRINLILNQVHTSLLGLLKVERKFLRRSKRNLNLSDRIIATIGLHNLKTAVLTIEGQKIKEIKGRESLSQRLLMMKFGLE